MFVVSPMLDSAVPILSSSQIHEDFAAFSAQHQRQPFLSPAPTTHLDVTSASTGGFSNSFCRQCLLDMDPTFFGYATSSLEAYIAIAIFPMLRGAKHSAH